MIAHPEVGRHVAGLGHSCFEAAQLALQVVEMSERLARLLAHGVVLVGIDI